MEESHRAFSRVLRSLGKLAEEGVSDLGVTAEDKDVELYPLFTLDLDISNRPVRQGMIRDTSEASFRR